MSKIVNGAKGPVQQPLIVERTPNRGLVTTARWECTNDADAITLTNLLSLSGWSWKRTHGAKPTVEATTSGDGTDTQPLPQANDTWELLFEDTQKDFLEANHFLTNALEPQDIKQLRAYMLDPDSYSPFGSGGVDSTAAAEYLFKLWKAGFRSIEVSQPIFRINRTIDRGYGTQWAFANVGLIFRTPRMITESEAPADFQIPLSQIDYPDPTRADGLNLAYGWKKYAPTLTLAGYDKRTIQQQYKFGLWDVQLYNVPLL